MSNLIDDKENSGMNAHQIQGAAGAVALARFEDIRRLHTPILLRVLLLVFGSLLWRSLHTVRRWSARTRQRHALLQLDDRLLGDIGLTREQQEQEVRKPFWMA